MVETAYARIYYAGYKDNRKVPYNNGKKMKITLISPRLGKLHNGIVIVLDEHGVWRLQHDSGFPRSKE